jgi:NAD+ synthase
MFRALDQQKVIATAQRFITGKLLESGLSGYVVGLSGGIDSALSAALAARAVGSEKLLAIIMPYRTTSGQSAGDAISLTETLGVEYRVIDISPMVDAYFEAIDAPSQIRVGNKMARERMSILFDQAHLLSRLVLGTSNRTEISLGYSTWYGDSASSVNPIGELYKTEVRALSRTLNLPERILAKAPSAELWEGQTDEDEIGVPYDLLDRLLERLLDDRVTSMSELESEGFETTQISRVVSMLNRTAFKRHLPAVAPMGREPIPDRIQLDT